MDSRSLRVLEFSAIIEQLAEAAETAVGRELCRLAKPTLDFAAVQRLQDETAEALTLLRAGVPAPFDGIQDVRSALHRSAVGAVLAAHELLQVSATVGGTRRLFAHIKGTDRELPLLKGACAECADVSAVEREIDRCIDDDGSLRDSASDVLQRIRRELVQAQHQVRRKMEAIVNSSEMQKLLQEPLITVRGDRFCVPVRSEHRSRFRGIIHDQSASGATVFMEPESAVPLNNRVRELRLDEKREEERILAELSKLVGDHAAAIHANLRVAAALDAIFARARLAEAMEAVRPELRREAALDLIEARHPLLGADCVPNDIRLGIDFQGLVVTGPNTGGKTVALKTVGLMALMVLIGLHLPVKEGSSIGIFRKILADIGDEQSIAQSLSTFSSHLTQIVQILRQADNASLVLLDEIGVGTDPDEGAALARAILGRLLDSGARVVATTHYSELKLFAYAEPRVENACVEFDIRSLKPTYRLLIGVPGSSNAFAIARRLGIDDRVIAAAGELLQSRRVEAENLMSTLEESRRQLDHETTAARREREAAEELRHRVEAAETSLQEQKNRMLAAAREEAASLVEATRAEAEELLRELRRQPREGKGTQQVMDGIRMLEQQLDAPQPVEDKTPPPYFERGALVTVEAAGGKTGVVVESTAPDGTVTVRVGSVTLQVDARKLQTAEEPNVADSASVRRLRFQKASAVTDEINVIGQMVDEATYLLDKYIDDALLAGLSEVRIIHGKGTGALRQGVQQFLRAHPHVASFRQGTMAEGGTGATVVRLK